jgi:cation transport regulator ChaC
MPDEITVRLEPGEVALFGYGSLLMRESMERSLGRTYEKAFVDCELDGWRRTWDIAMPNRTIVAEHEGQRFTPAKILYLNVRREAATRLNGVLFVVSHAELAAFDKREWIYTRQNVTRDLRGVALESGTAYTYVGMPNYHWDGTGSVRDVAVRRSYLALIDEALRRRPPEFAAAYRASTQKVPAHLIVDDLQATLPSTTPLITDNPPPR